MDTAFVVTWKGVFPGREKKALEFAAEAEEYFGKQAAEGHCTTPEWFFFPNGTGMMMVKGERRVLEDLTASEDVRRLLYKGSWLCPDWQFTFATAGSGSERVFSESASVGADLGFLS